MHKNGWRPFWAALGAALLVLLPLVGGTVLLTRQMVRTRIQTAQPQSGVPIQLPRAEHRMTLLLCTAGEQPGFLLVYLNAAQNSLNLLAVPGELTVPFNGETASLAHCYGAAGPARCRQALLEVLGLPEDMFYLALSPAVLEKTKATIRRLGLDALIVVGGDGSQSTALLLSEIGLPVVGVPKTIDNDLGATDVTFGFYSAVSIVSESLDRLETTANAHQRMMVVEVMGRHAGWIALERGEMHQGPQGGRAAGNPGSGLRRRPPGGRTGAAG